MTKYAFIVSAGAGDTIRDFYWNGQYASIEEMGPEDTCDVHITGINPFLHEFFSWHPGASQLTVKSYGYFVPDQEEELKRLHGIPLEGEYQPLPRSTKPVVFYPSPEDEYFFRLAQGHDYIVISAGAGTQDRSLSFDTLLPIYDCFEESCKTTVAVGKDFARGEGRVEPVVSANFNFVNQISLPGTCKLLEGAAGLVTCHSALSMLAWCLRKPQLLLYPDAVRDRHFLSPDMWSWGAGFPECVHTTFDAFSSDPQIYIDRFLGAMKVGDK